MNSTIAHLSTTTTGALELEVHRGEAALALLARDPDAAGAPARA